jgi:hypothetical protein
MHRIAEAAIGALASMGAPGGISTLFFPGACVCNNILIL